MLGLVAVRLGLPAVVGEMAAGILLGPSLFGLLAPATFAFVFPADSLMNTRGLMELIALNIDYDLGILSPRIFTMLVIMALVTTLLTGPLPTCFGYRQPVTEPGQEPSRA